MTAELPVSSENPRSNISFFEKDNIDFLAIAETDQVRDLLAIRPSIYIPVMHELWRIGRERTFFPILQEDKAQRAFMILESGEYVVALATLYAAKKEDFGECLTFARESLRLINKAKFEKGFDDEVEEIYDSLTNALADQLMEYVKLEKKRYDYYIATQN